MLKYTRPLILCALAAAACSTGDDDRDREKQEHAPPAAPSAAAPSVKATGKVIVVELYTDEKGNYFKPSRFEVHRGDMIRFTLMSGVHNVHFLPDSNPGKPGLPPVSEMLQLPGQTWEYVVSLAPGKYYFQCDPHAALGMKGRLEVEEKE